MTYRELLESIKDFSIEELDMDIAIYIPWTDEYHGASAIFDSNESTDVLYPGTPVIFLRE